MLLERTEAMLLEFASGVLTGAAVLSVAARRQKRRRATAAKASDGDDMMEGPIEVPGGSGSSSSELGGGGASLDGAVPVFPACMPLQHATEIIDTIREARAAASASVSDFRHNLQQHKADCGKAADLQQQLQAAEARAAQAQHELSQAHAQLLSVQQELTQLQASLQADLSSVQSCVSALVQQLHAAEQRHGAAEQQLQQSIPGELQSLLLQLRHARQHSQQKEQALEQAQAQLALALGQHQQQREREAKAAAQVLQQQEQQQQLQLLQAQLEAATAQLAEAEQQVQGLQATADARLATLATLQAQLADAQQQQQQQLGQAAADLQPASAQVEEAGGVSQGRGRSRSIARRQVGPQSVIAVVEDLLSNSNDDSVVPLAEAFIRALSGAGSGSDSITAAPAAAAAAAAAAGVLPQNLASAQQARPLSWLEAAQAISLDDEAPAASSLLDELRCESAELAQQLAQLQHYLRSTSPSKHGGDLNSMEAMDAGLQALRQLTGDTVEVAASTVERVRRQSSVRSAPVSMAGREPSGAGAPLAKQHASCAGTVGRRSEGTSGGGGSGGDNGSGSDDGGAGSSMAAAGPQASRTVAPAASDPQDSSRSSSDAPTVLAPTFTAPLDNWGSASESSWLTGDLQVEEELGASFTGGGGGGPTPAPVRLPPSRLASMAAPGLLAAWGSGTMLAPQHGGGGSGAAKEEPSQ